MSNVASQRAQELLRAFCFKYENVVFNVEYEENYYFVRMGKKKSVPQAYSASLVMQNSDPRDPQDTSHPHARDRIL